MTSAVYHTEVGPNNSGWRTILQTNRFTRGFAAYANTFAGRS